MKFDIITIFPNIFGSYFSESILKRAQEKGLIKIQTHNLRDFVLDDKHMKVDDTPCGGGAGMVMKVQPIYNAVQSVLNDVNVPNVEGVKNDNSNKRSDGTTRTTRTILFSAKGRRYTQRDAKRLSKYDRLILICGRYEGVDERVAKYVADEELSVGDFVLTGGEIPTMLVVDSVARLLPGVLGNADSSVFESHSKEGYVEHPQYTKPEEFLVVDAQTDKVRKWKVPKILLSGNHAEIAKWRENN